MTNTQLAELAAQDCSRVRAKLYELAGRSDDIDRPLLYDSKAWRTRDVSGERVFMNGGFAQFKASYLRALDALYASHVVQHLREGGYLKLEFHFCIDSGDNWRGDWGWFKWQIVRVYEIT